MFTKCLEAGLKFTQKNIYSDSLYNKPEDKQL